MIEMDWLYLQGGLWLREIANETKENLRKKYPFFQKLIETEEVFLLNPSKTDFESFILASTLTRVDVIDAEDRLKRFAP